MENLSLLDVAELAHQKLIELGDEYELRALFDKAYAGHRSFNAVLAFLEEENRKMQRDFSAKLKDWLMDSKQFTWTPSEKLFLLLRLVSAQDNLPILQSPLSTGSCSAPRFQSVQNNEALLWAVSSFWALTWPRFLRTTACLLVYEHLD